MKKIEDLFLTHELALIAREKGFDENCLSFWCKDKISPKHFTLRNGFDKPNEILKGIKFKSFLSAPTHQQIVDWLRENHRLHIEILLVEDDSKYAWDYDVRKVKMNSSMDMHSERMYDSYYEALNKAIEQAFKLI